MRWGPVSPHTNRGIIVPCPSKRVFRKFDHGSHRMLARFPATMARRGETVRGAHLAVNGQADMALSRPLDKLPQLGALLSPFLVARAPLLKWTTETKTYPYSNLSTGGPSGCPSLLVSALIEVESMRSVQAAVSGRNENSACFAPGRRTTSPPFRRTGAGFAAGFS